VVRCARCGIEREGAGKVGLPGSLGEDIEARICGECWRDWLATQIRVINHYGLRPAQREDRDKLYELTREFLQLTAPAGTVGGRAEPPDSAEV
jgi:Fe-S cluster biosynthesis and repair protein YggX